MEAMENKSEPRTWPEAGISRVPAWLYTDQEIFDKEMDRFHGGPTWNYVGLECEIPEPGSYFRTFVGLRPVVVTRDRDGQVHVVENRCAHRGAPVCWNQRGKADELTCVYHQWSYTLDGKLQGLPFLRGAKGKPGMPADFDKSKNGLRTLRVDIRGGVIWATYEDTAPSLEAYMGSGVLAQFDRVFNGTSLKLLGYSRQLLPCNWKLYWENTRDTYHAGLMHSFFTTFGIYRADTEFETVPFEGGKHEYNGTIYSEGLASTVTEDSKQIKSIKSDLILEDMETVAPIDEFGDSRFATMQIFPSLMFQQHANIFAVRHILPKNAGETELSWTFFGYESDTPELELRRLKQGNLVGPAGYVSMDDSEVLAQIQRTVEHLAETEQVIEMGGRDSVEAGDTMVTESLLRAFYQFYRRAMDL